MMTQMERTTVDPGMVVGHEWSTLSRREKATIRRMAPGMADAAEYLATLQAPDRGNKFTWFTDTFAKGHR